MTDPWESFLSTLNSDYQQLKSIMESGPYIKPSLHSNKQKKWSITFEEVWPDLVNAPISFKETSIELDDRIRWVEKSLENWTTAKRTSWDTWLFTTKRDAERFLILYSLTWET